MIAQIGFVTSVVTDMVVIFVLVIESGTCSCATFGASSGCAAAGFAVAMRRNVRIATDIAVVVSVVCFIGTAFNDRFATVIAEVVTVLVGV